ncbi:MAG TPA: hypothetical protein VFE62_03040 [Gemmataceae bacterium]|nr:hypothetical protein [Gemmataceae bacterium]
MFVIDKMCLQVQATPIETFAQQKSDGMTQESDVFQDNQWVTIAHAARICGFRSRTSIYNHIGTELPQPLVLDGYPFLPLGPVNKLAADMKRKRQVKRAGK